MSAVCPGSMSIVHFLQSVGLFSAATVGIGAALWGALAGLGRLERIARLEPAMVPVERRRVG